MKIQSRTMLPFACALLLDAAGAEAATFTINTTNDTSDADLADGICADINGKCSLRAAIMQANYINIIGTSNTIIVPAGVYTLTRPGNDDSAVFGDLDIAQPMTIQGAGSRLAIVEGKGAVTGERVFQNLSGAKETTVSGMTIRNGSKVAGTFDSGGGLYWDGGGGHLHLSDLIVESNASHYGGGIYLNYSVDGDVVVLDHVIVRNNTVSAAGGGLGVNFTDFPAGFDMVHCQVSGNMAFQGGGFYVQGSTPPPLAGGLQFFHIETTDIYSNTAGHGAGFDNGFGGTNPVVFLNCNLHHNAAAFLGGGIENYNTLAISNSTLYANTAGAQGGGIYTEGGTVTIVSSTISGNSVTNGSGGGVYNTVDIHGTGGTLNLLNSTIASNSAVGGFGGGVTNRSGTVIARDTIIAGNTTTNSSGGPDFAGVLTTSSSSYDLFGNSSGLRFSGAPPFASLFNVNPLLGPLQDNGGPTLTHALRPGSPALDAGNGGPNTDQRGAPRPVDDPAIPNANPGDGRDIGAFEFARPRLAIQKAGNAALLSWPFYYGGFTVQSVANPSASNSWTAEAGSLVVSSNRYIFTNGPLSSKKFYRLKAN